MESRILAPPIDTQWAEENIPWDGWTIASPF